MAAAADTNRIGLTIPLVGEVPASRSDVVADAVAIGYTDVWTSETADADAFTPLAQASALAPGLRVGTAIASVFTRGPATLAMSFAALADTTPGGAVAGIGASSPPIVSGWNGIAFERPWYRVRDTIRFLREAFEGGRVTREYETFSIDGFRLGTPPATPPPIHVAALREGMLRLAGREGDGAILNWLSPEDVARVAPVVREFGEEKEIVARVFVAPSEDLAEVRHAAKRMIAGYLTVPAYAAFHEWLGRGPALRGMWDAWAAGDRAGAVEAIPDEVVDELFVHGSPEACRRRIGEYVEAGVSTPIVALMPWGMSEAEALRALGTPFEGSQ